MRFASNLALVCVFLFAAACSHSRTDATPSAAAATDDDAPPPITGQEGEDSPDKPVGTPPPAGSAGAALLSEVDRELARMQSSEYTHRTHVDEASGTFDYDCSGLLCYALSRAVPDALGTVEATTTRRPRSVEFVSLLQAIAPGAANGRWQRVAHIQDLAPGDVIVWLKPPDSRSTNTGHTLIVHGAVAADGVQPGSFRVPVVDSTEKPHASGDSRYAAHRTGLGQGTIVLVGDAAGAPIGYRWSTDAKSREKVTTIALGRLR